MTDPSLIMLYFWCGVVLGVAYLYFSNRRR